MRGIVGIAAAEVRGRGLWSAGRSGPGSSHVACATRPDASVSFQESVQATALAGVESVADVRRRLARLSGASESGRRAREDLDAVGVLDPPDGVRLLAHA